MNDKEDGMPGSVTVRQPNGAFAPGNHSGAAGRPKGSRHKLGEAFVRDFAADWKRHGAATIVALREESPIDYVKLAAFLLPKMAEELANESRTIINVITGVKG